MLKMGGMCHCKATVAAFDAATGEVDWFRKRPTELGVREDRLSVLGDDCLYVLGKWQSTFAAAGRLIRRSPLDSPAEDWHSVAGLHTVGNERYPGRLVCVGDDGHVWIGDRSSPGLVQKLDAADGTALGSKSVSDFTVHLFGASGGDAFLFQQPSGFGPGTVLRLDGDSTLTTLNTYTEASGSLVDALQLGSLIVVANGSVDARRYRTLDTSLSAVNTYDGSGESTRDPIALGKISDSKFIALELGLRYAAYDTAIAQLWTNSTTVISNSTRGNWLFDSDGTDFYVGEVVAGGTTRRVQKRSGTDGSILWTATLTLGGRTAAAVSNRVALTGIAYCGSHVVAVGDFDDGSGGKWEVAGIDDSDGSLDWYAGFKPDPFAAPWSVTGDPANNRAYVVNTLGSVDPAT